MLMTKRLYRSRTDTVLGGVASGLADYLDADPALVRIAWALLVVLTGGIALLVYIVAWVVVPEGPEEPEGPVAAATTDPETGEVVAAAPAAPAEKRSGADGRAGIVVGIGLVVVGAWFLLREFVPDIDWGLVWPLVLVGVGALILVTSMRRRPE
jgi:phage shock protein C